MSREQFEKLPEIRKIMNENGIYFMNHSGWYEARDFKDFEYEQYINGAWYAFQEQQKSHQQETERLKNQLLAAEAEIARLQSALDELKEWCRFQLCENDGTQWDAGWCASHRRILNEINRITGADK